MEGLSPPQVPLSGLAACFLGTCCRLGLGGLFAPPKVLDIEHFAPNCLFFKQKVYIYAFCLVYIYAKRAVYIYGEHGVYIYAFWVVYIYAKQRVHIYAKLPVHIYVKNRVHIYAKRAVYIYARPTKPIAEPGTPGSTMRLSPHHRESHRIGGQWREKLD
jgi:hypothetical protein